jgi:hypothetical protein
MTWILVQHRGWQSWHKIDGSYLVQDIDLIKRVRRQMGEPVIAVVRLKRFIP